MFIVYQPFFIHMDDRSVYNRWSGLQHLASGLILFSDGLKPQWDDTEAFSTCGDDNVLNCQFDDGNSYSDVEDSNTLVSQPRQVAFLLSFSFTSS